MNSKPKLVISTGAGMSAESGLSTFRDSGGLWDNYNVMDVASADGFARNPELVHNFYNIRRREVMNVEPNEGHRGLVELEKWYDTYVITQNVDNLHERAGSSNVVHLHGELMKIRSLTHPERVYELGPDNLETTVNTIGTSLVVYPAAALLHYVRRGIPVYYIDPNPAPVPDGVTVLKMGASEGVRKLVEILRPK